MNTERDSLHKAFSLACTEANLELLRRQNAELIAENEKLRIRLAAWPGRATSQALTVRERVITPALVALKAARTCLEIDCAIAPTERGEIHGPSDALAAVNQALDAITNG